MVRLSNSFKSTPSKTAGLTIEPKGSVYSKMRILHYVTHQTLNITGVILGQCMQTLNFRRLPYATVFQTIKNQKPA